MEPIKRHCMVVYAHYPMGETRVQRQTEALLERGVTVDVICLGLPGKVEVADVNGATVYHLPLMHRFIADVDFGRQFLDYLHFFWLAMLMLIRCITNALTILSKCIICRIS